MPAVAGSLPDGVTTEVGPDRVRATAVVDAPPDEVFELLRRPANHRLINGDGTVRGTTTGPERLQLGDRFGMRMHLVVPYRVQSKVVELEEGRRIAWCHLGGHRWRWELEPVGAGRTRLTETFDMSTARFPPGAAGRRLPGAPRGERRSLGGQRGRALRRAAVSSTGQSRPS
jgi:uncharacterized protein YndB with AHSA1/START domain